MHATAVGRDLRLIHEHNDLFRSSSRYDDESGPVVSKTSFHEHRCLQLAEPRANVHAFGPDCPETANAVISPRGALCQRGGMWLHRQAR
jgi:hypothetical protein